MNVWLPTELNEIKNSVMFNSTVKLKKIGIWAAWESSRVFWLIPSKIIMMWFHLLKPTFYCDSYLLA